MIPASVPELGRPPIPFLRALAPVLAERRFLGKRVTSPPLLALLVSIRAVGAFVGFAAGPGVSPRQVR